MSHLSYETIDWNVEAIRVARAFGVEGECEFEYRAEEAEYVFRKVNCEKWETTDNNGHFVGVEYWSKNRYFCVGDEDTFGSWTSIVLGHDGTISKPEGFDFALPLARALFHLNLLTIEVEEALQVTISAHEKIEWELEYQARLETLKIK